MADRPDLATVIEELEAQERAQVLTRFTNEDAFALGSWLWAVATERSLPITIDVQRGEQRLFHAAKEGTFADNDCWIDRKAKLVRRVGSASYLVGRRLERNGDDLADLGLDRLHFAAAGGCVPVVVDGVGLVGTLTVSGLDEADDHALAVEALSALMERTSR